jgi:hypothetical protein
MTEYRPVVDGAVVEFIANSKKSDRERLLRAFQQLGNNPFQKGEFIEQDLSGRPVHVKRFEKWRIAYWPDHGACELRIAEVRRLKR